MPSPTRLIIDTDPGVDDILALLFALAAEDLDILLISVTFGNVDTQNCLRNVVSMFHVIERQIEWSRGQGSTAFESLQKSNPLVAVGADVPLDEDIMMATYFHGIDGLGGVHTSHQHFTPSKETWETLFISPPADTLLTSTAIHASHVDPPSPNHLFLPSRRPSHLEILRILEENPPDTICIVAVGPLTNIALAAAYSPQTLMRAQSILVMGGAIQVPGNMAPFSEFNIFADSTAAARVFALTSPDPASTMPPDRKLLPLQAYPRKEELGPRRLNLILFPLDITTQHYLRRDEFEAKVKPLIAKGSPLAEWTNAFMCPTFDKMELLHHGHQGSTAWMSLHDPFCIWYALTCEKEKKNWTVTIDEDIRVETAAQWTRGMCVVDRRDRKRGSADDSEVIGDTDGWLDFRKGNRLKRCIGSPGERVLAPLLLQTIFG